MPEVAIITGSAGLVGSEAALHFGARGLDISGVDNDMRAAFFGNEASTKWNRHRLEKALGRGYRHFELDVRDRDGINKLFRYHGKQIGLVIHAAAQPSHDWAAREPLVDFDVNARGTLNVLEATRLYAPEAVVIFTSTNKVYGDTPNCLPLIESETRWEIEPGHTYATGIREDMSIDHALHSLFGVSKLAADLLTQEYGRYFDLRTACFRAGTLTGPQHSATELHGFLAYVMRSVVEGRHYRIFGYKGKQVRDAIHSADLVRAFDEFFRAPREGGQVYNIGGGRASNVSVIEAIRLSEDIAGRTLDWSYCDENRVGDHMWWISDNGRFESHFPAWKMTYDAPRILSEIHASALERIDGRLPETVIGPR
jgi:CDP-paratose 2-epimerase